jgi:hemolysin III
MDYPVRSHSDDRSEPAADRAVKPLLRGWLHAGAAVVAVAVTVLLLWRTRDDPTRMISMLVFGLSMVELYSVSAAYHIGGWVGQRRQVLRALDHANIFVLIAGTYTPICVNVLDGSLRIAVLGVVWTLAIVGIATTVLAFRLPRWVYTGLYVLMGWVALVPFPSLTRLLPWPAWALLIAGGVFYTVGAVVYARRRPDPFPRVFGFHEVFHSFVIAGSSSFAVMIWVWVVPFPRI